MEVELGHNPSYVWRILLCAREITQEGLMWRVRDGQHIEVEKHKWLSHLMVPFGVLLPFVRISDLLDDATWQ